jgi:hypothetical protein
MAQINIEPGNGAQAYPLLNMQHLPDKLAEEGALHLELHGGIPVIKASSRVQNRIESLVDRHQESGLSETETEELDRYEEIDDFLSFLNRVIRNLYSGKTP